jgi:hypothetical protein
LFIFRFIETGLIIHLSLCFVKRSTVGKLVNIEDVGGIVFFEKWFYKPRLDLASTETVGHP